MTRDEIKHRLCKLISEGMSVEMKELPDATRFKDDLEMDSLDEIELVMAVEEEFDIEIDDSEADSTKTVGNAIDGIISLLLGTMKRK